jgi:hypothetical protein
MADRLDDLPINGEMAPAVTRIERPQSRLRVTYFLDLCGVERMSQKSWPTNPKDG